MNKTQTAALELLRARLDPKHPMFAGSTEVNAALEGQARPYFQTYVLPVLDYLLTGEQWPGQADAIKRDHGARKAAADARRQAIETGRM